MLPEDELSPDQKLAVMYVSYLPPVSGKLKLNRQILSRRTPSITLTGNHEGKISIVAALARVPVIAET